LAAAAPLDRLEWLNLAANQIGTGGATALAAALRDGERLGGLRRLSLDRNQLDDGAMQSLAATLAGRAPTLEVYLESNPAGEEAVLAVLRAVGSIGEEEQAPRRARPSACRAAAVGLAKSGCACQ